MIIRPASHADADAICEIWNRVIRETGITFASVEKSPQDVCDMIDARKALGFPFLVLENNSVRGFASMDYFRGAGGYAQTAEHSIVLASDAWGQGAGRAMMTALERDAKAAGIHSLIGAVSAENMAGLKFHAALGYREVGRLYEVGRKFDRWFDLVLMQKML